MFVEAGNTYVNKLRASGGAQDPLALRIRLERALASARLHPTGLPSSAILCVRKLRDPLPGALRIEAGILQAPVAWERAVAESLDQLAVSAARPALGYVPLNAEAVVFLDQPELLACLASDWIEGAAATRWWWRSIFKAMDATSALVRAWIEAPEYAPVALARLASSGKAARFAGSLDESGSRQLLSAIIRRFALQELGSALETVLLRSRPPAVGTPAGADFPGKQHSRKTELAAQDPPWRRWVKETAGDPELTIAQESLLAVGLMLVRAPTVIRSRSFVDALNRWNAVASEIAFSNESNSSALVAKSRDSSGNRRNVSATHDFVEPEETDDRMLTDRASESSSPTRSDQAASPPKLSSAVADRNTDTIISSAVETDSSLTTRSASGEPATAFEDVAQSLGFEPAAQSLVVPIPSSGEVAAFEPLLETHIETQFGGVFYLINACLFLNLYGDFTTPEQPGIDLAIWDFLALAAQRLSERKVETDPVWKLLAQLSGRAEDEPPGQAFDPPDAWRLPGEWLSAFPEECIWAWELCDDQLNRSLVDEERGDPGASIDEERRDASVDEKRGGRDARAPRSRLRVWHPEKFLVVDVPLEEDPEQQLIRETRDYTIAGFEYRSESSSSDGVTSSKLDRWLGWLMPYLRARLARALGLQADETADGPKSLSCLLLEQRARVVVTATHLDVFFSLEEHPLEIRLAGLDRDAGWVPAAGRYITFHYQ